MRLIEEFGSDETQRIEEILDIPETDVYESTTRLDQFRRQVDLMVLAPLRIAWSDWRAKFGFLVVSFFVFMGVVWARYYPQTYYDMAPRFVKPFDSEYTHEVFGLTVWQYPLGTDDVGRPILQRIVNAAPAMLELIVAGAVISVGVAVVIGTAAGYKGGTVDDLLMAVTDVILTIPGLPFVVLIASVIKPEDPFVLGMILAIDNWPGLARALRSQVLTLRQEAYVEASRSMGISVGSILAVDIVPQLMPYILVNAANAGKRVIIEATALYFLGFLESTSPNWGKMMDRAYGVGAITNPDLFYQMLYPMLVLALLSFGLVLLAQGLDQVFNPRLRARHAKTQVEDEEDTANV